MWRLLLSGLFCLPALVLLLLSKNDNSAQVSWATISHSAVTVSDAVAPAIHVSLPPAQFSIEPGSPDPTSLDSAGLTLELPLQGPMPVASLSEPSITPSIDPWPPRSYVAMRRQTLKVSGHTVAEFAIASKSGQRASDDSGLLAFFSRNLTTYSFALPNQNSGG
jgi:hypothetical protein